MWAKPSAWNIGAATWVASPALIGTFESSAAAGISERGASRGAPFGVPVVPLVSSTTLPCSEGDGGGESDAAPISASSESGPGWPSHHAVRVPSGGVRLGGEARVLLVADQQLARPRAAQTSRICGPAKSVLR